MFKQKNRLYVLTSVPVALICLGAMALSARALFENLRFVEATNMMSTVVNTVRSYAKEQRTLSFNLGEDILGKMIGLGQISPSSLINPWQGGVRAIAAANMGMRIESDLPAHICRRTALYLLGRKPEALGLLSIEAESGQSAIWMPIYPNSGNDPGSAAQNACGKTGYSHLALVFKIME